MPYEETKLARRSPAARRRLAALLVAGAAACAVAAWWRRDTSWLLGAASLPLVALVVLRGRLGGLIAAALAALVTAGLSIWWLAHAPPAADAVALAVALALALASLPDVVLLVRDAELQHAYGMWARRG